MKGKVTQINITSKQVQTTIEIEGGGRIILIQTDTDKIQYKVDQEVTVTVS